MASHSALKISLLLLILPLLGSCRRPATAPFDEGARRASVQRFEAVIRESGGLEVWVKTPGHAGKLSSAAGDVPRDVVAASPVFDAVFSAVRGEARRQGLETRIKSDQRAAGQGRLLEIRLSRQGERAGLWRLREVRELRRAAIIIDDLGIDLSPARQLLELPGPLTFSVLPHLRHSAEIAEEAHRAGREVMLHLPMQPESGRTTPGAGVIKVGLSGREVDEIIERGLGSVPYARGANNHMGSRATADPALMAEVMKALAERHLYFVDSRTTPASVALDSARREGIPTFFRSVFLDDTRTVEYSLGQLREFRRVVEEHGAGIAIGHPYPTTLVALAESFPEFERADIKLVPASEVVRLPAVARLSPPRRTFPRGTR